VLTPAPKVRRPETPSPVEHWTKSFQATSAPRTRLAMLPLMWLLAVCTVVFPVAVWSRSDVATDASKVHANLDNQPAVQPDVNAAAVSDKAVENKAVENEVVQDKAVQDKAAVEANDTNNVTNTADNTKADNTVVNTSPVEAPSQKPVSTTEHTSAAANSTKATANEPVPNGAALPNIPNPELALEAGVPTPAATPAVRTFKVRAIVSGKTRTATVKLPAGATVAQALLEMGIATEKLDRVSPLASAKAYNGMTVRVTRVRTVESKRTVTVEPEFRYQPTTDLASGREQVVQQPQTGVVELIERVWSKDGKVTLREVVSRKVKRQAKDKIVAVGVRPYYMPGRIPYHNRYARAYTLAARGGSPRDRMAVAPVEGKTLRRVRSVTLVATGYSPDPRENGGYTRTATGLPIGYGAAAVDPRVIPLGTKLYVEGYGYAFACDTGGAIKGNRIDLAYDSYYLANTKGRKKVRVWILAD